MSASKPNVIVICSDTYRPDYIAANGRQELRTPELDDLLARSITFDRATVSSFPTIPMRTDFFTGRFSHPRHGWKDLDREAITLPAVLNANGYTTQLIADTTHMLRAGFWRPFNAFHFERGHEGDCPFTRLNDPMVPQVRDRRKTRVEKGLPDDRPTLCDRHAHTNFRRRYEDEGHSPRLADLICRWIEDNYRGGPFMLWADFFDVHEPWYPPRYLMDLYHPGYEGDPMPHPNYTWADAYEPEELADLRARYAGMCTLVSKSVGRILRLLDDTGLWEDTILLFTSDHGIYLGERGRTGKSLITREAFDCFPFYRELSDICWSMHVPASLGLDTLAPGSRVSQIAQAPDLMPTALDLCGIEPPDESRIEGRSLTPWLKGATDEPIRDLAVTAWTRGERISCAPAITDGRWTLLLKAPPNAEPPALYDLSSDPQQTKNVIADHADEAGRLHRAFLQWLADHDAARARERFTAEAVSLGG
ncbi:MAG: sulfatase [Planctomycetota bacterium]